MQETTHLFPDRQGKRGNVDGSRLSGNQFDESFIDNADLPLYH